MHSDEPSSTMNLKLASIKLSTLVNAGALLSSSALVGLSLAAIILANESDHVYTSSFPPGEYVWNNRTTRSVFIEYTRSNVIKTYAAAGLALFVGLQGLFVFGASFQVRSELRAVAWACLCSPAMYVLIRVRSDRLQRSFPSHYSARRLSAASSPLPPPSGLPPAKRTSARQPARSTAPAQPSTSPAPSRTPRALHPPL